MNPFEIVSSWEGKGINLPKRKTAFSAGYDIECAEDTVIPSHLNLLTSMHTYKDVYTLDDVAALTKKTGVKPTLVPTGLKCKLDDNDYLQLSVRSSCPLKYWLLLANSVGVIDADYYGNGENEGHIMFQIINLFPAPILLKKGDTIGQGIILPYKSYELVTTVREGGFGSSDSISS